MKSMAQIGVIWKEVQTDPTLCIYTLQDAAANPRIYPNLILSGMDSACLYEGPIPKVLEEAAPHVVRLVAASPYTRWYLGESWGKAWGLALQTRATLTTIRQHFRTLLLVRDERGNTLRFRFFDPRVLRRYLPTCTPSELKQVFGPVTRFFLEHPEQDRLVAYSLEEGALKVEAFAEAVALAEQKAG
jgi:Domain of unknown function (DUF4123)